VPIKGERKLRLTPNEFHNPGFREEWRDFEDKHDREVDALEFRISVLEKAMKQKEKNNVIF